MVSTLKNIILISEQNLIVWLTFCKIFSVFQDPRGQGEKYKIFDINDHFPSAPLWVNKEMLKCPYLGTYPLKTHI